MGLISECVGFFLACCRVDEYGAAGHRMHVHILAADVHEDHAGFKLVLVGATSELVQCKVTFSTLLLSRLNKDRQWVVESISAGDTVFGAELADLLVIVEASLDLAGDFCVCYG